MKAVLFDLDGTLLDIDIEPFLRDYFGLLGPVISQLTASPDVNSGLAAVVRGTEAMSGTHPGRTNEAVFNETFHALTGLDLSEAGPASAIEAFYRNDFPGLRGGRGPRAGARAAYDAARESGMKVALATNPIFPRSAIRERAAWAGFELDEFDHVTSYETSTACKPAGDYFLEVAASLGVDATDCIMVGDDAVLDQGSAAVGMSFFYVGPAAQITARWNGGLSDVAALLQSEPD